jgi:hypothetical protein
MSFLVTLYKNVSDLKWIWWLVIGIVVLLGAYAIYACIDIMTTGVDKENKEKKILYERGYFEGQRDALDSDIRIKKLDNRHYVWLKTPYDDTTKPVKDTIVVSSGY